MSYYFSARFEGPVRRFLVAVTLNLLQHIGLLLAEVGLQAKIEYI